MEAALTVFIALAGLIIGVVIAILSIIGVFIGLLLADAWRVRESYEALEEWKEREL